MSPAVPYVSSQYIVDSQHMALVTLTIAAAGSNRLSTLRNMPEYYTFIVYTFPKT